MKRAILGLILSAAAGVATAAPPFTDPQAIKTPTPQQVRAAYPKPALSKRIAGIGTMRCVVMTTGRLSGCVALGENPGGQGFAKAAVTLAPLFEYAAATENDGVVEASVDVPVHFNPPPESLLHRYGLRALLLTAWAAVIIAFVVRRHRHRKRL